VRISGPKGD
jgi:uncharacterized protein affecting Mg2+/Co2+ transport